MTFPAPDQAQLQSSRRTLPIVNTSNMTPWRSTLQALLCLRLNSLPSGPVESEPRAVLKLQAAMSGGAAMNWEAAAQSVKATQLRGDIPDEVRRAIKRLLKEGNEPPSILAGLSVSL